MSDPALPPEMETEDEGGVLFQSEDIQFELGNPSLISSWIEQVITQEQKTLHHLSFIFCSDPYLHQINLEYLNHDTYTDIITFPYSKLPEVEGDIFISIDRVRENAQSFDVSFENELHRVIIHGVLHLCGYTDKTSEEKKEMSSKEDTALQLLHNLT